MSDQQVVADWMDLALKNEEQLKTQTKDKFADEEKILTEAPKVKSEGISKDSKEEEPQKKEKHKPAAKTVEPVAEKPKPMTAQQKRKAELLARLNAEKDVQDLFSDLSVENKQFTPAMIILKTPNDFANFAKTVVARFDEDVESELLQDFGCQILIDLYKVVDKKQYQELAEKLKVLKNEKKKDEKDKKKKKDAKKEEPKKDAKKEEQKEQPKKEEKVLQAPEPQKPKINRNEDLDDFM